MTTDLPRKFEESLNEYLDSIKPFHTITLMIADQTVDEVIREIELQAYLDSIARWRPNL